MKKKEKSSYHGMTENELQGALAETQREIESYLTTKYTKQIKNTREIRNLKKRDAVIMTILKAKELQP